MPRLGINIPQTLLDSIDSYAKADGYTRSEFIRHALRLLIEQKGHNDFQNYKQTQDNGLETTVASF